MAKLIRIALLAVLVGPVSYASPAAAQYNDGFGYVCETVNIDTGECEYWREVPQYDHFPQQPPQRRDPSYDNDYIIPPGRNRPNNRIPAGNGSGLMPSTDYAPGFGTSHQAPPRIGRR